MYGKKTSKETIYKISQSLKNKDKFGCISMNKSGKRKYRFRYTLYDKKKSKSFSTKTEAEIAQKIYIGAYRILETYYN